MNWTVEIKDGDLFMSCNGEPDCYLCGFVLEPSYANRLKFSEVPYSGDVKCRAIDIFAVCPNCHKEELFGVAVNENESNVVADLKTLVFA